MWATYLSNLYIPCNAESLPTEFGRIDALSIILVLHIVNCEFQLKIKAKIGIRTFFFISYFTLNAVCKGGLQ